MTTPSPSFTVNGVAIPGEFKVAYGSTVSLALASTSGLRGSPVWSIVGNDKSTRTNPTITAAGSPSGATASFTMPADPGDGLGMCFIVKCVVNGGKDTNGDTQSSYTATAVVGVVNSAGRLPFAYGEETERSVIYGYVEALNQMANSAASLTAPTTPGQDGLVAVASAGDLAYGVAGTIKVDAIGAVSTPGLTLENTTASLAYGDQYAPFVVQQTEVWSGAATTTVKAGWQLGQDSVGNVEYWLRVNEGAGYSTACTIDCTTGKLILQSDLSWVDGITPTIKQISATAAGNGRNLELYGQPVTDGNGGGVNLIGEAGVGTNKNGGNIVVQLGLPTGTGTAKFQVQDSTAAAKFQVMNDGSVYVVGIANGVAHFSGGGLVSSSTIVNADVDAAAAIACTKTDGAFTGIGVTGTSFTASSFLAGPGTLPAAGDIRLQNSANVQVPANGTAYDTDGTYYIPRLPKTTGTQTTTTSTASSTWTWTGSGFTVTSGTWTRALVVLMGVRTSDHKVFIHEADLDCVHDGTTLTIESTNTAANSTSGVSPKVDTIGCAADVAYGVSGATVTVTVTPPASTPGTIVWTARVWLIEETAI